MVELNRDITPENASRFAADVVAAVEENEGVTLDYSVESLAEIDRIIDVFRADGTQVEDVEATLFVFGCYVGEVFVRNAGATWRKTSRREIEFDFGVPLVLQMGSDKTLNPINKVFKRLENGDVDSLLYFYRAFAHE